LIGQILHCYLALIAKVSSKYFNWN